MNISIRGIKKEEAIELITKEVFKNLDKKKLEDVVKYSPENDQYYIYTNYPFSDLKKLLKDNKFTFAIVNTGYDVDSHGWHMENKINRVTFSDSKEGDIPFIIASFTDKGKKIDYESMIIEELSEKDLRRAYYEYGVYLNGKDNNGGFYHKGKLMKPELFEYRYKDDDGIIDGYVIIENKDTVRHIKEFLSAYQEEIKNINEKINLCDLEIII